LLEVFEQLFGETLAWKGYPYGIPPRGEVLKHHVWKQLRKSVVTAISHRVVALASFNGNFAGNFMRIIVLCLPVVGGHKLLSML
jgi:hypothetical protein